MISTLSEMLIVRFGINVVVKNAIFSWRFLSNRIATQDNLFKRGVLYVNAENYIFGCGFVEILYHLFFVCSPSHKVWCGVFCWLEV